MLDQDIPLVLRVPEIASLLRISRAAAYEMCKDGRLQVVRIGKSVRVPRAAVERLLAVPPLDERNHGG